MKRTGIVITGVVLKAGKLEPVKRYQNVSQKIAAKKNPKKTWRKAT